MAPDHSRAFRDTRGRLVVIVSIGDPVEYWTEDDNAALSVRGKTFTRGELHAERITELTRSERQKRARKR